MNHTPLFWVSHCSSQLNRNLNNYNLKSRDSALDFLVDLHSSRYLNIRGRRARAGFSGSMASASEAVKINSSMELWSFTTWVGKCFGITIWIWSGASKPANAQNSWCNVFLFSLHSKVKYSSFLQLNFEIALYSYYLI